jgi:hypothetical protein
MGDRYDQLWQSGRLAVSRGETAVETGDRWPLSVVLRLDDATRATFAALTDELAPLIGAAFRFDLTLTASGVTADLLRDRLAATLAAREIDGFERSRSRDTWHSTLIGFAGPVAHPGALIDFVGTRRTADLGTATCARTEVTGWSATVDQQIAAPISALSGASPNC